MILSACIGFTDCAITTPVIFQALPEMVACQLLEAVQGVEIVLQCHSRGTFSFSHNLRFSKTPDLVLDFACIDSCQVFEKQDLA